MADTTVIQYQKIWLGRHNPFSISILRNGESLDSTITKITIKYKTFFISSASYPLLFDFSDYETTGKVDVDLSGLALTVGFDETCEIIVHTEAFPDTGIVCEPLLHLEVTDEVLGDETLVDPIAYTWQPALLPAKTVVADYQVELIDFLRPSIRVNALVLKTMTMPVMTEAMDGARITFFIKGVGDVDIVAYAGESTTFGSATATKMVGFEQWSSITLEYDAEDDMFHVVTGTKGWHGEVI